MTQTSLAPMKKWQQYWALTKPRVTQLAVFCAIIGMFLATPGMVPWPVLIGGSIGIWLLAGAAFAVNCLVEQKFRCQNEKNCMATISDWRAWSKTDHLCLHC